MKTLAVICTLIFICRPSKAQDAAGYKKMVSVAHAQLENKNYAQAARIYDNAIASAGDYLNIVDVYNAACSWARAGNKQAAFKDLFLLATYDFADKEWTRQERELSQFFADPDFETLRSDTSWQKFTALLRKTKNPITNKLDSIMLDDQYYRWQLTKTEKQYGRNSAQYKNLGKTIAINDSLNQLRIDTLLRTHGWPTKEEAGSSARAVFSVIQHASLARQKKYLPVVQQAVRDKKLGPQYLAMLQDRMAMLQGKPQVYGTQVFRFPNGDWFLAPVQEPDSLDARRKTLNLGRIQHYLLNWNIKWDLEAYKQQIPALQEQMTRVMKEEMAVGN